MIDVFHDDAHTMKTDVDTKIIQSSGRLGMSMIITTRCSFVPLGLARS